MQKPNAVPRTLITIMPNTPLSFPTFPPSVVPDISPFCHSRRFPLVIPDVSPFCHSRRFPFLSFPTFSIGNPGFFPSRATQMKRTKEKKTGFPLKTCGNDREGTGRHDRRETCGHDRGETCRHDRRETCRHDRGTRRFCRSRRPPLSFPTFLPLLSFPTFLIGNPGVFPMQGHMNEKDKRKTLDSR